MTDSTAWGNIVSDGVRMFEYDQSNRLIRITKSGVVLGEYAYDAFNRRVKKIVDGKTTHFHYDADGLLICETDAGGNAIRDYVYLNREPVAMRVSGIWYWFLCDHLGTPQKLIDNSGNLVWEAAYLPFGKARVLTAEVENNLRFPGQYFDEETELHYNWHRYYDPETGRYISADPIGLSGGVNLYAYVQNDPVNFIDPHGLFVGKILAGTFGRMAGRTAQESAVAGMMADGTVSLAIEASGASPNIPGLLGYAADGLQIQGGTQLVGLGSAIAAQGIVTPAIPAALAGGGGYLIGLGINNIYERISGQSLGGDIYDWEQQFHEWLNPDSSDPCFGK